MMREGAAGAEALEAHDVQPARGRLARRGRGLAVPGGRGARGGRVLERHVEETPVAVVADALLADEAAEDLPHEVAGALDARVVERNHEPAVGAVRLSVGPQAL